MIRINLLPPEITQKRKEEQYWRWLAFGAVALVAILLGVYVVLSAMVMGKQSDLAAVEQQVAALDSQISQVQMFQQREEDLKARSGILAKAIQGRVDWARLLFEMTMTLPDNTYLTNIAANEDDPLTVAVPGAVSAVPGGLPDDKNESLLTLAGIVLDSDAVPDTGYKVVAKLLVRLADLSRLDRVWLDNASKTEASGDQLNGQPGAPMITFSIQAKLTQPPTPSASPAAAAPPTPAPAP